jgi:hypothetical protein
MLNAARAGKEYFALRMASQAAVMIFDNPWLWLKLMAILLFAKV